MKIETLSIHVGREVSADTGAVAPPIHLSTTFERDVDGDFRRGYSYARPANPIREGLSPRSKAARLGLRSRLDPPRRSQSSAC